MTADDQRPARSARRGLPSTAERERALAEDRAQALTITPVSRETMARLDRFVACLLDWQDKINLIAPSTEPRLWTRHIADSLQLLDLAPQALAPQARRWVDLGSGAGFPGLMIACALAEVPGAHVDLVESNRKKAAFLEQAIAATGACAQVHPVRIADFIASAPQGIEVVTARALAPLDALLGLAYPLLKGEARGLFPKGQDVEAELTAAAKCWKIQATLVPSRTDRHARIVVVEGVEPIRPGVRGQIASH